MEAIVLVGEPLFQEESHCSRRRSRDYFCFDGYGRKGKCSLYGVECREEAYMAFDLGPCLCRVRVISRALRGAEASRCDRDTHIFYGSVPDKLESLLWQFSWSLVLCGMLAEGCQLILIVFLRECNSEVLRYYKKNK